jgi:DNA-binding CsgD family transcriptional regulator
VHGPAASVIGYGALLGLGTLALQAIDYLRFARTHPTDLTLFLVAGAFLALGVAVGVKAFARPLPTPFDGNPPAVAALGISPRELTVLQALAAGQSNKEIARSLGVSPNTIKTHVARLFEKLDAQRRTEAIHRARTLGILR